MEANNACKRHRHAILKLLYASSQYSFLMTRYIQPNAPSFSFKVLLKEEKFMFQFIHHF